MANLLPDKPAAAGQVHALVVGTSVYPHALPADSKYGVETLASAARTASEFAEWLLDSYSRRDDLASLRVLLSPSDGEPLADMVVAALPPTGTATTLSAFKAEFLSFMQACKFPDSTAIVYLAGHGVQVSERGATVLIQDYLAPGQFDTLEGSVDAMALHASMDGSDYAQTQFWFVDACRQPAGQIRKFDELGGGFGPRDRPLGEAKVSPVFLSSSPASNAYAKVDGVSLFGEALDWALQGAMARGPDPRLSERWHISTGSLVDGLGPRVEELAGDATQVVDVTGRVRPGVLHELDAQPATSVSSGEAADDQVELRIRFDVGSYHLRSELPWALMSDGATVATGTGESTSALAPGTYELRSPLPAGEHVSAVELVDQAVEATIAWAPKTTEQPRDELAWLEPGFDPREHQAITVAGDVRLQAVRGARVFRAGSGQWVFEPAGSPVEVPTADFRLSEALQVRVSLPINPHSSFPETACTISLTSTGSLAVGLSPERVVGATLLGYLETRQHTGAHILSQSSSQALMGKYQDPAAAALGGITMDRYGELNERAGWVRNLARDFEWLPDGAVLRAKLALIKGATPDDLEALLNATAHRMMYTDTLLIAIELLTMWPHLEGGPGREQARSRLQELRRLSAQRRTPSTVLITEL